MPGSQEVTTTTDDPVVPPPREKPTPGCAHGGMAFLQAAWIVLATAIALLVTWVIEQGVIEGAFDIPDFRWLVVAIYGLVVMLPAAAFWLFARGFPAGRYHLSFALAGLFALLQAPTRLLPILAEVETFAAQALATVVFLLVVSLLPKPRAERQAAGWQGLGLALLAAGSAGIPWIVWGALGSFASTLLILLWALLFGMAASQVLGRIFWWQPAQRTGSEVFFQGGGAFVVLLVMVSGLGANGNQGLLAAAVPVFGWGLAALAAQKAGGEASAEPDQGAPESNLPVVALLAALVAFWPAAFFDPDELAVALRFGLGDLLKWSALATLVAVGIALLVSIGLVLARRSVARGRPGVALYGVALLLWATAAGLYLIVGQPGFYGDRLYVILNQQANLDAAAGIQDAAARRNFVYRTLVEHARKTQAGLRTDLDRWGIVYRPYYLENALEVDGGPLLRLWLVSRPDVDRVVSSPVLRPLPAELSQSMGSPGSPAEAPWNLRLIGADRVWQELGITGQGILIGQMDSGVQADHPELADGYRGRGGDHDYNWLDPWYGIGRPYDYGGHGTHTLGSILGNQVGVAPDAEWIGCVNLARNLGNPALYLDCMQFTFAPYPLGGDPFTDGRPELGAHVTNNSWGCPEIEGCDPATLFAAVQALRAAGVFVVSSAGNDGFGGCETVTAPISLYAEVYSVGAVDREGRLAPFSSLGPVEVDGSGRLKPDIIAPGVDVVSAYPGGTYYAASGTSMAGPHVAGVVALMWSANPGLIGDIDRTTQILNETARPYTGPLPECVRPGRPNNAAGYGVVDAYQAVLRALED